MTQQVNVFAAKSDALKVEILGIHGVGENQLSLTSTYVLWHVCHSHAHPK